MAFANLNVDLHKKALEKKERKLCIKKSEYPALQKGHSS